MADGSKLARSSFARIYASSSGDVLITDTGADAAQVATLEAADVHVIEA